MSTIITTALAAEFAAALKTGLDGGKLYIFGGTPVPATASAPIAGSNTLLATITVDGDGATGLTFETPTTGALSKNVSESWKCDGADVASGTATFYRFCEDGDDGTTSDDTKVRVQGSVGNNPMVHDLVLSAVELANGTDVPIDAFQFAVPLG